MSNKHIVFGNNYSVVYIEETRYDHNLDALVPDCWWEAQYDGETMVKRGGERVVAGESKLAQYKTRAGAVKCILKESDAEVIPDEVLEALISWLNGLSHALTVARIEAEAESKTREYYTVCPDVSPTIAASVLGSSYRYHIIHELHQQVDETLAGVFTRKVYKLYKELRETPVVEQQEQEVYTLSAQPMQQQMNKYQPNYKSGPHATSIARKLIAASQTPAPHMLRTTIYNPMLTEQVVECVATGDEVAANGTTRLNLPEGTRYFLVACNSVHFGGYYYIVVKSLAAGRFICSHRDAEQKAVHAVENYLESQCVAY